MKAAKPKVFWLCWKPGSVGGTYKIQKPRDEDNYLEVVEGLAYKELAEKYGNLEAWQEMRPRAEYGLRHLQSEIEAKDAEIEKLQDQIAILRREKHEADWTMKTRDQMTDKELIASFRRSEEIMEDMLKGHREREASYQEKLRQCQRALSLGMEGVTIGDAHNVFEMGQEATLVAARKAMVEALEMLHEKK
jgi:hypothetical protein